MDEEKLYKGLRIKVWSLSCGENRRAGGYSIIRVDMFSEQLIKEMNPGSPFESCFQEAEELAVLIDAELILDGEILRRTKTGDYK